MEKSKKILLIDDDDDLREIISWALKFEGFTVRSYSNPKEALKNLLQTKYSPEVILLDFQMDEMKGSDFLKEKNLIPRLAKCPVVMITASPEEVKAENVSDLYLEMLIKPLDLSLFVNDIKRYVS